MNYKIIYKLVIIYKDGQYKVYLEHTDFTDSNEQNEYEIGVNKMTIIQRDKYITEFQNAKTVLNKLNPKKYIQKDELTLREKVDYLLEENQRLTAANSELLNLVKSLLGQITELKAENAFLKEKVAKLEAMLRNCTCQNVNE